jgi:capsular exopolysaccharide synthesis family protein
MEESIRMLRTTLLQRLPKSEGSGSAMTITSAGTNVGKTTLAILLARSLQQLEKRVLLVDTDFRRSSLSRMMGVEDHCGLVELLTGQSSPEDVVVSSSVNGFHLLPAGKRQAREDSDLLANGIMSACIKRWKEGYDFVILDGPPALSTADGRILAGQTDGAIMVLRASQCTRGDAVEASAGLSDAGATLLGTVLVGARDRSEYYAYDNYQDIPKTRDVPQS